MTTSVHDVKEVARCFEELCDGYLVKPINLAQLLEQVQWVEASPTAAR